MHNRPIPMTGRGRSRIEKELWKLRYDRDLKRMKIQIKKGDIKNTVIKKEVVPKKEVVLKKEERKVQFLHCKKVKVKKEKYCIKNFLMIIIFFFFKVFKPSWFFRKVFSLSIW